jgi:hypothetical protein
MSLRESSESESSSSSEEEEEEEDEEEEEEEEEVVVSVIWIKLKKVFEILYITVSFKLIYTIIYDVLGRYPFKIYIRSRII